MQNVKPQRKNQKFSLSAYQAEIAENPGAPGDYFLKNKANLMEAENERNISNSNNLWRFLAVGGSEKTKPIQSQMPTGGRKCEALNPNCLKLDTSKF